MFDTNFGTDPEVFVVDENESCIPPASLREDHGYEFLDEITLVQEDDWKIIEDGAATEINVDPSSDLGILYDRITRAIEGVRKFASDTFGLGVKVSPTVKFDTEKFWEGRGEEFRTCVMFGCDPDLDIYSGEYSPEIAADEVPERFGGGHIHMQAPENDNDLFENTYYYTTRLMDILVGSTAVAIKRDSGDLIAEELKRLQYYGRPGKIRLQNYNTGVKGIEYRTPSNFWIRDKESANLLLTLMNSVFNLTQHPADASKILEANWHRSVPKDILGFDQRMCRETTITVLEHLKNMKYISYDQAASFVPLII
jgi:hypothetical protein